MELKLATDFTEHNANFFVDRSDYDGVSVLLIFWKDGDLDVDGELMALRQLFGEALNFHVASFPLPSDGKQQARLRKEVAAFIDEFALEKRSLSIIYYTGHCVEFNGKAKWAAYV